MDLRLVPLETPPEERVAAVLARKKEATVGLGVADLGAGGLAKVRSFFVDPDHWRQGIGRALVAALEARAQSLGATRIEAMFEGSGPTGQGAERLAEASGWRPSQPRTLVCRASAESMARAPLLGRGLPEGFELFPWSELSEAEGADIRARQAAAPWFPPSLDPFAGPPYEPLNSLGLRHQGQVVGWMITHRMGPNLTRFTSLFVRPEHRGTGLALLGESIRRAVAAGLVQGIFGVGAANQEMVAILGKHLRPYLDEFREIAYVAKDLR